MKTNWVGFCLFYTWTMYYSPSKANNCHEWSSTVCWLRCWLISMNVDGVRSMHGSSVKVIHVIFLWVMSCHWVELVQIKVHINYYIKLIRGQIFTYYIKNSLKSLFNHTYIWSYTIFSWFNIFYTINLMP